MKYLECVDHIVESMKKSKRVVVLTGAGISTASGLPVYRSGDMELQWNGKRHIEVYNADASKMSGEFVQYTREFQDVVSNGRPNIGHRILESWIKQGLVSKILTQNVDGYHGKKGVIELHGNINRMYCEKCGKKVTPEHYYKSYKCNAIEFSFDSGGYTQCRGVVRPDVTLFGEDPRNMDLAMMQIYMADLVLVLGTSLTVSPVNMLPALASQKGAEVIIVNRDEVKLSTDSPYTMYAGLDVQKVLEYVNALLINDKE